MKRRRCRDATSDFTEYRTIHKYRTIIRHIGLKGPPLMITCLSPIFRGPHIRTLESRRPSIAPIHHGRLNTQVVLDRSHPVSLYVADGGLVAYCDGNGASRDNSEVQQDRVPCPRRGNRRPSSNAMGPSCRQKEASGSGAEGHGDWRQYHIQTTAPRVRPLKLSR